VDPTDSPGTVRIICRYNYTRDRVFLSSTRAHRAKGKRKTIKERLPERQRERSVVQGNLATHERQREKNEYICWGQDPEVVQGTLQSLLEESGRKVEGGRTMEVGRKVEGGRKR
jgi:hypothetical protein